MPHGVERFTQDVELGHGGSIPDPPVAGSRRDPHATLDCKEVPQTYVVVIEICV